MTTLMRTSRLFGPYHADQMHTISNVGTFLVTLSYFHSPDPNSTLSTPQHRPLLRHQHVVFRIRRIYRILDQPVICSVHGSTLTLSPQGSAYLIAFIALFVRLAGGQLWPVLAFLVAVGRSTTEPQDALYHQQQAILRNASSPAVVTWTMAKLLWAWKGSANRAGLRTFTFIFTGLTYTAAFAVAGILSSRIASINSEVLSSPTSLCGSWPYPYLRLFGPAKGSWQDYSKQRSEYDANAIQLVKKSHNYVAQCHKMGANIDETSESCLPYGKNPINWSTNLHAPCPFDQDMCIAEAVEFDTGFLDSNTHLVINTNTHDRI
jgi:hypothetical protein